MTLETLVPQEFSADDLWVQTTRLFEARNRRLGRLREETTRGIALIAQIYLREEHRWEAFLAVRGVDGPRRGPQPQSRFHGLCRYLLGLGVGGDKTGEATVIAAALDLWLEHRQAVQPEQIPEWIMSQGGVRQIYDSRLAESGSETRSPHLDYYAGSRSALNAGHGSWNDGIPVDLPATGGGPAFMQQSPHLHLGDCIDILPTIPGHSADLILTDPPYGRVREPWDQALDWGFVWLEYRRIIRPYCPIVIFGVQPFAAELIVGARDLFKFELIWLKTRAADFVHANNRPRRQHENILVFSEGAIAPAARSARRMPYYPRHVAEAGRYPRSVIDDFPYVDAEDRGFHPTQKPVALLEYLICMFSRPGDLVLDPCMGSGSTGIAARRAQRRFIGIEKYRPFFNLAAERISALDRT